MKLDWIKFVPLKSPEGADGGGGAGDGSSGTVEGAGAGEVVAGDITPAPAATFLTQKPVDALASEGDAKVEGEVKADGEAAAEAPAAFDISTVTLPEGFTLDEKVGKSFAEIFSDANLSPQERGQKFLDLHTAQLKTVSESLMEQVKQANNEAYVKMNNGWREEIKALPEFKNNPDAEAGKVMQALISVGAGEEFFKAIDLTGAGNHPAILQVLHKLTSPYFEGTAVVGQGKTAAAKRLGDNIYTSANKA